jgi:hypothetical protein
MRAQEEEEEEEESGEVPQLIVALGCLSCSDFEGA